jgi:hypothetical protein
MENSPEVYKQIELTPDEKVRHQIEVDIRIGKMGVEKSTEELRREGKTLLRAWREQNQQGEQVVSLNMQDRPSDIPERMMLPTSPNMRQRMINVFRHLRGIYAPGQVPEVISDQGEEQ